MSKQEKLLEKLKSKPKDFTYDELKTLLNYLGFYENDKGKTSGSRVEFKDNMNRKIRLHKPHPSNIVKMYKINEIIESLEGWRLI